MREAIIAALNEAFRGFSFPGGRWSTGYGAEMAVDALLVGPLAPVFAEIDQLRSRLLEAEKGAEAMRKAAKIACLDLNDAYREASENHMRARNVTKAREAMDWAIGALECAHAVAKLSSNQEAGDHEPR